ncbi:MAG: hypothetical protein WB297_08920 [Actinomycetota bacterium]
MVRRALSAAVGVIVGLALVPASAAATSEPVTKIRFTWSNEVVVTPF